MINGLANSRKYAKSCKKCGEIFYSDRCDVVFCSSRCLELSENTQRKHVCKTCGSDIFGYAPNRSYCSDKCRPSFVAEKESIATNCPLCGKHFSVYGKNKDGLHFCSGSCRKAFERGARPGQTCKFCGNDSNLRQFCCPEHQGKFESFGSPDGYNNKCISILWQTLGGAGSEEIRRVEGVQYGLIKFICECSNSIYGRRNERPKYEIKKEKENAEARALAKRKAKYSNLLEAKRMLAVWYANNRKTEKACAELGIKVNRFHRVVLKTLAFRRAMKKKRELSSWRKASINLRSMLFPYESQLQSDVAARLAPIAERIQSEVMVGLRGRRVDLLLNYNGATYAIECKAESKPTCVDEAIGQAMVDALVLGAVPVVCMPSDIIPEEDIEVINKLGVLITTEKNIVDSIKNHDQSMKLKAR